MHFLKRISYKRQVYSLLLGLCGTSLLTACNQTITPDLSSQEVNDVSLSSIVLSALVGDYNNCLGHPNQEAWSLNTPTSIAPQTVTLPPVLSVVLGDDSCQLHINSILFEETNASGTQVISYQGITSLLVDIDYQFQPIGFTSPVGDPTTIYANVMHSSFNQNFTITVKYSSAISALGRNIPASFSIVGAQVIASSVSAPSYTFLQGDLTIGVDATNTIISIGGAMNLVVSAQAGQNYVVTNNILQASNGNPGGNVFNYNDVAYTFSHQFPHQAIPIGGNFSVNGGAAGGGNGGLGLSGSLPQTKYLIIENYDSSLSIGSYQVFTINFHN